MFFDLLRLSTTNLLRARTRLIITASGVLIGTTAVILLIGLTIGLQESAESGVGENQALTEILVFPNFLAFDQNPADVKQINFEIIDEIQQLPEVESVIPMLPLALRGELRVGSLRQEVPIVGIDLDKLSHMGVTVVDGEIGQFIAGVDVENSFQDSATDDFIPVSAPLLNENIILVIPDLTASNQQRLSIQISALVESDNDDLNEVIFIPMDEAIDLQGWILGRDISREDVIFDELLVISTGRQATLDLIDILEAMGFTTSSIGDYLRDLNNFFNLMRLVLGGVGGVALLIAAFGVANTMMVAILERTAEIGLLKAIGARDRDVLLVFLLEAGLVGMVGGVIGVGLSLFLQNRMNTFVAENSGDSQLSVLIDSAELTGNIVIIPTQLLLFAVILATFVGVLAGFIPAWRASRLSPVSALKQE